MLHPYLNSMENLSGGITEGEYRRIHHIRDAMSWDNFILNQTAFPELDKLADKVLIECLGYYPSEAVCLPFMPYLKALINNVGCQGEITDEMIEQVKLIRNRDMYVGFWDRDLIYTDEYKEKYSNILPQWRYAAQDYMAHFIGDIPPVRISFIAEIFLRNVLEESKNEMPIIYKGCFKAITIYKFRKAILDHSHEAALHSDLFFINY